MIDFKRKAVAPLRGLPDLFSIQTGVPLRSTIYPVYTSPASQALPITDWLLKERPRIIAHS